MTDIVIRLRAAAQTLAGSRMCALLIEAADRVTELEADLAAVKADRDLANNAYVAVREIFRIKDRQC